MKKLGSRLLALFLAVMMLVSLLPAAAFAADAQTFSKISGKDDFVTGQYVMVLKDGGISPTKIESNWIKCLKDISDTDGVITDPDPSIIWDITVDGDTAELKSSDGNYISPISATKNGIQIGEYKWKVIWNEDGTAVFATDEFDDEFSSGNGQFIGYNSNSDGFRAYNNNSSNPGNMKHDFTLYKLSEGEVVPDEPAVVYKPAKDDVVVIFYNSELGKSGYAMTAETAGSNNDRLAGAEGAVANGKLTVKGEPLFLTVDVLEEGENEYYTFESEGKYLTSGATGNSLTLEAQPSGNLHKWRLEADGEHWHIYNVEAAYNGNANQAIEYFSDAFYPYGYNSNYESSYVLTFYKQEDVTTEEPVDPTPVELKDGSYVIWVPAFNKALSSERSAEGSFYNGGVDVTYSEDTKTLSGYQSTEIWDVKKLENGNYEISFEGKKLSMGSGYTSTPFDEVNAEWTLESAGEGLYYVKNAVRNNYLEWYETNNNWSAPTFKDESGAFSIAFYPAESISEPPTASVGEYAETITHGDKVVIYYPVGGMVLTSMIDTYNGNSRLKGEAAKPDSDNRIEVSAPMVEFTVVQNGKGEISFVSSDGKYLTSGATGSSLTLEDKPSDYSLWQLEQTDGGYHIANVNAKYNTSPQYIEYYGGVFTTYSYQSASDSIYVYQFYKTGHEEIAPPAKEWAVDADYIDTLASWAGTCGDDNRYPEAAVEINGDEYTVGDRLSEDVFTAVVSGNKVTPYTSGTSTSTNTTTYYMGGTGVGSGTDDYLELTTSSAGYGDMELSFRLRASNTGAGEWTLRYSTDGENWFDIPNGAYHYSYTDYSASTPTPVTKDGTITDAKAKTSLNPAGYVEFSFDMPAGADNAENLSIRLVPSATRAKGDGTPSGSGTVRIDTVKLTGSPIVDESFAGFVTVYPDGIEEDQAPGTELELSSSTKDAVIKYRFVDPKTGTAGEWETYDADKAPVVPETLPAVLEVYAESEGKTASPVRRYTYSTGTVESVKVDPNGGGVYIKDETSTVTITLSCATAGADIYYNVNNGADWIKLGADAEKDAQSLTLKKGFEKLTLSAYAKKEGFKDSPVTTRTFTERSAAQYTLYFGQMHSHTSYSDGAGTAKEAYEHVKGLDHDVYNMDFLSVTDHSNSFDNAASANIMDGSASDEWTEGQGLSESMDSEDFAAIFGYEMTWSNGLGHINTFNTQGFQSRTQSEYSTYSTALQNYYATLKTVPESVSQFNHPGTTFGDFSDFAHYDAEIDELITLIEVGNGEGAIGSSGYFPSYEYYTRALDKGWHVAPTNNQDNHKGGWGSANTARDVVLVDELTDEAIYDAMRNYRVYATEDLNLNVYYTFDGSIMGTILDESSYSDGDTAEIKVVLSDKDDTGDAKFEVIVNGGKSLTFDGASEPGKTVSCNETVTVEVPTSYNYYYIKITQADGNIAVTAPVWIGAVEAVGVSSFKAENELTVAGREQGFNLELYNNENKSFKVDSIVFTDKASGDTIYEAKDIAEVKRMSTASTSFRYAFPKDGVYTVAATVKGTLDGMDKVYTQDLELTVLPAEIVTRIVVDGSHYNDYVTGYYGGRMGNMTAIAASSGVQVEVAREITAETLENCSLLVISAPAKKSGSDNAGEYKESTFEDDFIKLVKDFVDGGGNVIVCGLADYQDNKGADKATSPYQSSEQINKLLKGIGSGMSINDDEAYDDDRNGGQQYRLYPETFNKESIWTKGIITGDMVAEGENSQTYSQYSGCTVNPGENGEWLVRGFDSTYSIDSDSDGRGGVAKGEAVFLAHENIGEANVFVAGGVFVSDFEVAAELDNIWDLPYANRTIYENILSNLCATDKVTPIADTRKAELNRVFAIEGYVTSGTTNPDTTFFDAIYVQDSSGGTCVFPYSEAGLELGTKVRVLGYTDHYQGDREIQVISLKVLDEPKAPVEPTPVTTAQAFDYDNFGGMLVKTKGIVSDIVEENGIVSQFRLTDDSNVTATVFIDGYIWGVKDHDAISGKIAEGMEVEAAGLMYLHPEGSSETSVPVIRVRNRDEITLGEIPAPETYTVAVDANIANGKVSVSPESSIAGEKITVTVEANEGYEVKSVSYVDSTGAHEITAENGEYSFVMPAENVTVTAVFEEITVTPTPVKHRIILTVSDHGDVTVTPSQDEYEEGAEITITAKADDGYRLASITVDGVRVASGYVLKMPNHDVNITVEFEPIPTSSGSGGYIGGNAGSGGVEQGKPDEGGDAPAPAEQRFDDVPPTHWASAAINSVAESGWFTGVGNGLFAPNQNTTRAQIATVIYRMSGSPDVAFEDIYPDVPANEWFSLAVVWGSSNGILNGTGDGFKPLENITREQIAVMLWRMQGSPESTLAALGFDDSETVSAYASPAMHWAVECGLFIGDTDNNLRPADYATRAEIAAVIYRYAVRFMSK